MYCYNFLNYKTPPCSNCSTILQKNNKTIIPNNKIIIPNNKIIIPNNHKNNNATLHFFPNLNQINHK